MFFGEQKNNLLSFQYTIILEVHWVSKNIDSKSEMKNICPWYLLVFGKENILIRIYWDEMNTRIDGELDNIDFKVQEISYL